MTVGDALGAPVEFLSIKQIKNRYGPKGLRDFKGDFCFSRLTLYCR
jgi:ADP-ribosylglycohydrolase